MTESPRQIATELKTLTRLATPAALLQVGTSLMGMVDTLVVGQHSAQDLAGIAAGHGIFWTLVMMGMGFLFSLDTLVSQAYGRGDDEGCRAALGVGLVAALVISVGGILLTRAILPYYHLAGASPEVVATMVPFVETVLPSFPLFMFFFALQRYWQALQVVTPVTAIIIVAGVLNYLLDLYLVTGRWGGAALGAVGAAKATLITRTFCLVTLILVSAYLARRRRQPIRSATRSLWCGWRQWPWMATLRLGIPASIQVLVEVGSFALVSVLVARLGAEALATHQIVLSIASMTFQVALGISMATTARVGMHWGAGRYQFALTSGWLGVALAVLVMSLFAVIFALWSAPIVGVFTNDPQVLAMGLSVMVVCAAFQVFDGVQVVATAIARGLGNTSFSLVANIISFYMLGIPIGWYFVEAKSLGLLGLWMGLGTGLIGTAILMTLYLYQRQKRVWTSPP